MTSPVTHFEIHGEEPAKLAEFYSALFGWQLEKVPGIDYWRVQTGSSDGNDFSGGLTYRAVSGARSWIHYVNVASLEETVAEVQRLGGAVLRPKTAVPKTAWYAVVADPEGNIFAVGRPIRTHFHCRNRTEVERFFWGEDQRGV
jgi:predicted enzyme related to lactoylglutathione lyase